MISGLFRRVLVAFLVMMLAVPAWSLSVPQYIRTNNGDYAVFSKTNSRGQVVDQMIIGPRSQELFIDKNSDGVWDHYELAKDGVTIKGMLPRNGHFMKLEVSQRRKKGFVELTFLYEPERRTYRMISRSFRKYALMFDSDIVIGRGAQCASGADLNTAEKTAPLAMQWNAILAKLNSQETAQREASLYQLILDSNRFLSPTCSQGQFADSQKAIARGMAEVMASSFRTTPGSTSGRYLQCMDQHGLGVHADRMRAAFMTTFAHGDNAGSVRLATAQDLGEDVVSSNSDSQTNIKAATLDIAKQTEVQKDEDDETLGEIRVRCEYKAQSGNIKFGSWDSETRRVMMYVPAGTSVPSPRNNSTDPLHPMGKADYAAVFFHEMVHESGMDREDEDYVHAIGDCCSLPNGYDKNAEACKTMDDLTIAHAIAQAKEDGIRSIPALGERYDDFDDTLIDAIGPQNAGQLTRDLWYRFSYGDKQCIQTATGRDCSKPAQEVLQANLLACRAQTLGASAAGNANVATPQKCIDDYNRGFAEYVAYETKELCKGYVASQPKLSDPNRPDLSCESLSTKLKNVFGSCVPQQASVRPLERGLYQWWATRGFEFAARLFFGKSDEANADTFAAEKECLCFTAMEIQAPLFEPVTNGDLAGSAAGNRVAWRDPLSVPATPVYAPRPESTRNQDPLNIKSLPPPGKTTTNANNERVTQTSSTSLDNARSVSREQFNKQLLAGHEHRSTVVLDSAASALASVKDTMLPTAHASESKQVPDSSRGTVAKSGASAGRAPASQDGPSSMPLVKVPSLAVQPVRISDPFAGDSSAKAATLASSADSNGKSSSLAKDAGGSSGNKSKNANQANAAAPGGPNTAPSPSASPALSGANSPSRSVANIEQEFHSEADLMKFLRGRYTDVYKRLDDIGFRKLLIDYRIQITDHAAKVVGSRQPKTRLMYSTEKHVLVPDEGN